MDVKRTRLLGQKDLNDSGDYTTGHRFIKSTNLASKSPLSSADRDFCKIVFKYFNSKLQLATAKNPCSTLHYNI